jgi:DNA-binding transcriptional LysR family regulator
MKFDDQRLRIFLRVAEIGSFTGAGKDLGMSQPAVSQAILTLESNIGVRLFKRTRSEVRLTPQGSLFKTYAERILYWYEAADGMFGAQGIQNVNKPVRISADTVSAAYILPPALAILREVNPRLSFEIKDLGGASPSLFRDETHVELSDGVPQTHFGTPEDADVEISVAPSPYTMDFEGESRLAGVMEAAVVAPPQNERLSAAAIGKGFGTSPFSTLAGIPVGNKLAIWSDYHKLLSPDLIPRLALVCDSPEAVKSFAMHSPDVAAVVPEISVRGELAEGRLLRLPVSLPSFTFDIHYNALPEFGARDISRLLRKTLQDFMS